ncbi:MAG TPA: hypothetical protein VKZ86_04020 [Cyclobacteriaceae bacterium]|nr:hypothetical protein [Cyclobacteriaceae bacterium]
MYSIEHLFSLVKSMTKSEKRHFRLTSDLQRGEKSYMALYDILESSDAFDAALETTLKQRFRGSSIEPARKHLYQVLIKSLRQFNNHQDVELKLMTWLQDSRILYYKGLHSLSLEQLIKVKRVALAHEKYMYFILAARQELQYLVRSQFGGVSEDELIEKQEALKTIVAQESSSIRHAMLYEILLFRYWKNGMVRSQEDVTLLNDLLLEEYQVLNTQTIQSFHSQQLHLHFQSIYFTMINNPEGGLTVFRELDELFQRHPHLWEASPLYYVHLLGGILENLRMMERYDELPYYLDRLRSVNQNSSGLSLIIKYMIFEYELQSLVDQRKYKEASALINQYQPDVDREIGQLTLQARLQVQFVLTRARFVMGDYSKALRIINEILNQPSGYIYRPLHVLCRLMNLQINAMLENTEYLVHAIRSVERKLKAEPKLFEVEKLVLTFLKRWLKLKPTPNLPEKLQELEGNPFERRVIHELNLPEWVRLLGARSA